MSIFEKEKSKRARRKTKQNSAESVADETGSNDRQDREPTIPANVGYDTAAPSTEQTEAKKLTREERRKLAEATLLQQAGSKSEGFVDVSDRIVKMLRDRGIVTSEEIEEALKRGSDSENLWRMLLDVDGVNSEGIYGTVATDAGIPEFLYLDASPSREFIDELVPSIGHENLLSLLDRGLLPVDQEPGFEMAPARLSVATFDPTHPGLQEFLGTFSFKVECRYAKESALNERLDTVSGWVTDVSRYGTLAAPAPTPAAPPEEENQDPVVLDTAEDVINLGSYGVGDAIVFESDSQSPDANSNAPAHNVSEESGPDASQTNGNNTSSTPNGAGETDDKNSKDDSGGKAKKRKKTKSKHPSVHDRVLDTLLSYDIVSMEDVKDAQLQTKGDPSKDAAWRFLSKKAGVSREDVFCAVADLYAFKHATIEEGSPDHDFVLLAMETIAETRREELIDTLLIPFEHSVDTKTGVGRMIFVTHDPTRPEIHPLLHKLDLGRFELRYAPESDLKKLIQVLFPKRNEYLDKISGETSAMDLGISMQESGAQLIDEAALEAEMSRSNLINLFEATLIEAVRLGASDIHVIPNPNRQIEISFRNDGRLKLWHTEDGVHPEAFLAVVKDNSQGVDRFERDAAQDGFIQRVIDDALIRFRVSILPIASANATIRAESIVIRILDDRKVLTDLGALGMLDVAKERFDKAIRQPHGMVILTGPTGSGKSTTLVAALYQTISPEVNVLTVEDPVEYIIKGVRQIKLSHKLNLDSALRSILRHDPDIVMVGEMRDQHTAELAIKLANTGHLTFSTLHTNDAPAAVSRLYKMGIEPFLIAYAINLVVAQRLIRTVCPDCRLEDTNPDEVLMRSLGFDPEKVEGMTLFRANRGSGCVTCSSMGYKGRRALCETLYFTDEIRHMIANTEDGVDEESIRDKAVEQGMLTLQDSARVLVAMGETTLSEMLRVTGAG